MISSARSYGAAACVMAITALAVWCVGAAQAQKVPADSSRNDSLRVYAAPIVVVSATRTEKSMAEVVAPVSVITAADIRQQGMLRLDDALGSLAGLALVDYHGTGLQMQGLAPEYTLILMDGEPVIGRTAGTLDLQRLTTHGLERIEIVRGPASSLYGSEALAGVVNLVTDSADKPSVTAGVRAGSFGTTDLSAKAATGGSRGGLRLMVNRHASSGYDLAPDVYGATVGSFAQYVADLRSRIRAGNRASFTLGSRVSTENQSNVFATAAGSEEELYTESANALEWSLHPEAKVQLSSTMLLTSTLYAAGYRTRVRQQRDADGSMYYKDHYHQVLTKAETQFDAEWSTMQLTTVGSGITRERLNGDRYDSNPDALAGYAFVRHEWQITAALQLSLSARYDAHAHYEAQLSPNAGLYWHAGNRLQVRLSVGRGFKAPALRQRYLAFTNAAAGYSVFGSERLTDGLRRLQMQGQLRQIFINLENPGSLSAENAVGVNAGFTFRPWPRASVTGNLFYNGVRDLIETQPVAQKTNGTFVYGYFNIARVYTRGIEVQTHLSPLFAAGDRHITLRVGYQFLQARDPEIVRALRRGDVFGRLPSGRDVRLGVSDYPGLFGRSPHMASITGTAVLGSRRPTISVRGRWRSRYGYRDLDGNRIAQRPDEFVGAYGVLDISVTQPLYGRTATVRGGMQNAFSVTRPQQIPTLPGRRLWISLNVLI